MSGEQIHEVIDNLKDDGAPASGDDWVGIDPDGNVWTGDGVNNGPWTD